MISAGHGPTAEEAVVELYHAMFVVIAVEELRKQMNQINAHHQHQTVRLPGVHGVVWVGGVHLGQALLLQALMVGESCRDGEDFGS